MCLRNRVVRRQQVFLDVADGANAWQQHAAPSGIAMIDRASRWGSNMSNRRDALQKQIAARGTGASMLKIVEATLTDANPCATGRPVAGSISWQ